MSALPHGIPTFYRGYRFSGVALTPKLAFLKTLTQRAGRSVAVYAEVADIVNRPALAFLNHQHFIFPALGSLFNSTRSGILRASRFGMVEALATSALSAGVELLENGFDCSSPLRDGS